MNFFWQKNKKNIVAVSKLICLLFFVFIFVSYPSVSHAFEFPSFSDIGSSVASFAGTVGNGLANAAGAVVDAAGNAISGAVNLIGGSFMKVLGIALYGIATMLFLLVKLIYNIVAAATSTAIEYSLNNSQISMNVVESMWTLIRDMANMTMIFIIMYLSVSTVLNLNGPNTNKLIGKVILVGLMINFSLAFSEVVIDMSNILGLQIYSNIVGEGGDFSNKLGDALSIDRVMDVTSPGLKITTIGSSFNEAIMMFGITMLLVYAGWALYAASKIFFQRIIYLMLCMIFSPLAFTASILPQTESLSKKWWSTLTSNAFVAPAYLFMILVALNVTVAVIPKTDNTPQLSTVISYALGTEKAPPDPKTTKGKPPETAAQVIFGFTLGVALFKAAAMAAGNMTDYAGKAAADAYASAGKTIQTAAKMLLTYGVGGAASGVYKGVVTGEGRIAGVLKSVDTATAGIRDRIDPRLTKGGEGIFGLKDKPIAENAVKGLADTLRKSDFGMEGVGAKGGYYGAQKQAKTEKDERKSEEEGIIRDKKTEATIKTLKDRNAIENSIPGYLVMSPDTQKTEFNKAVQVLMKDLNQKEQSKVAEGGQAHILENLTNKATIKEYADKQDDAGRATFKAGIMNNPQNKEGQKVFAVEEKEAREEAKKATELAVTDSVAEYFANKVATGQQITTSEIKVQLDRLPSPKAIVNIIPTLRAIPQLAEGLESSHLVALHEEMLSGSNKISQQEVKTLARNSDTVSAKALINGPGGHMFV